MTRSVLPIALLFATSLTFSCGKPEEKAPEKKSPATGESDPVKPVGRVVKPEPDTPVPQGPARITRGPYPQAAAPDSMHLVWRVRNETQPVVRYGTSWSELNQQVAGEAIITRRKAGEGNTDGGAAPLFAAPSQTRQYEARITGLKPDTKYYYAVYDGARVLSPADADHSFTTLPVPGTEKPLLMWVVGDSGMANRPQEKVHRAMRAWLEKEKRALDLYIHVGDMAYGEGLDTQFQLKFFQVYQDTLRNTVCWPALGNHEGKTSNGPKGTGPYFDSYVVPTAGESGGVPSGTEQYYSFDIGRVHFICLNSFDTSRKVDGPMAQWLKADLEKTKQDWIIAFFHHPPYTKGSHDSDDIKKDRELVEMRENILPILEGGGVDLVLAGHSHIYERSFLIDGAYATPTTAEGHVLNDGDGNPAGDGAYQKSAGLPPHAGSVSIVAGHGGATLGRKLKPSPVMRTSVLEFGSLLLDLKGDTVTGIMLNSDGVVRDTFQLIKRGKVELARIATPKPPGNFIGTIIPRPGESGGKTAPLPENYTALIPKGAEWEYFGGKDPGSDWSTSSGGWKIGKAGFGYGDDDDVTVLPDMRGQYRFLCIRRSFELTGKEDPSKLGLAISFDDGFICYLNGKEVARDNVASGSLQTAKGVRPHNAEGKHRYYPLAAASSLLKPGKNMIAIEIHNDDLDSSDLSLDPFLILTDTAASATPEGNAKDDSAD
jgi:3',5'-cyclic AMP phosphodiesterase CpdA